MTEGYLNLVLHAHLPFVRHPEHAEFLEEDWFFEAVSETYIPLIDMFDRLRREAIPFRFTLSISPPLAEMLADPLLQERYLRRINKLVELAEKETARTRGVANVQDSARMYLEHFRKARDLFERYNRNLVTAFRELQDSGVLEILTCTATHAFLPTILNPTCRESQVRVAVANYVKHFGRPPRGIWLAECGYQPGDDHLLARNGLRYFFQDTHGVLFGHPRPRHGIYAPVRCPSGVASFPRDPEASEEVWSAQRGYPGEWSYREFYRDLGFDADYAYIRPYLHPDGVRRNVGIKYHRVTGPVGLGQKEPYVPAEGLEKAALHAHDFIDKRTAQVRRVAGMLDGRPPLVTTPFDAELFGHWWFEGPMFLEYLVRKLVYDQEALRLVSASEYLEMHPDLQDQQPTFSSWGAEGYSGIWLNGKNEWIYRHQHMAENRMVDLAHRCHGAEGLLRRALNQAARELLLAQSSDWAFIMTTGTTVPYAVKRFKDHIHRFNALYAQILEDRVDEAGLAEMEHRDSIFQEIDYQVFQ